MTGARTTTRVLKSAALAATMLAADVVLLTLFLNPSENDRVFRLPTQNVATRLLIDSLAPDKEESDITTDEITVAARSAVLTKSVIEAPS